MPNYKSKMLTFLSIGEMTGLLLDNTDEDGILFAVATDSTNFKIVMWRKNSTATVDNQTVYPANGPGRWHVLATGSSISNLTDVSLSGLTTGQALVFNGTNWVNQVINSGGDIIEFAENTLPASPSQGKSICIVKKNSPDRYLMYRWNNGAWELISYTNISDSAGSSGPDLVGDCPGQIFTDIGAFPKKSYIYNGDDWVEVGTSDMPLDGLADVTLSGTPSTGQSLVFNGTEWVNQQVSLSLNNLSNVAISNVSTSQVLSFNGSQWANRTLDTPFIPSVLDDLTDVTISTPLDNQVVIRQSGQWVNQVLNINKLSDVLVGTPSYGQVLTFDGARWVNQALPSSSINLNALTDVVIINPANGHTLVFDGTQWVNQPGSQASINLYGLADVTISSPSTGQGIVFDGTTWVNQNISTDSHPFISSASPLSIQVNTSTTLTLTGINFTPSTTITIPDATVSNIQRVSPSSLVLSVLGSASGSKSLTLSNGSSSNMAWTTGVKSLLFFEGDLYSADVTLLIRGNGTHGSTAIVDESNNPKTITLVGNTSISTTQSKYGGSSIYFDGAGDLLQLANTTAFNFAGNNFTLEFWIYPINSTFFVGKGDAATAAGSMFSWPGSSVQSYYNGGATASHALSLTLNTWQHIAVVRNGTSYILYKNGVSHSTVTLPAGATLNSVASPLQFGGYAGQFIQAYFDSIRVTNLARYTSAFNPETDTYLN